MGDRDGGGMVEEWRQKLRPILRGAQDRLEPLVKKLARSQNAKKYAGFVVGVGLVAYYLFSHDLLYFVSLLAELLRTLGIMLLVLRVTRKTQSVSGLSLKTQQLYAVVFLTRLMFKVVYEQDYLYAMIEVVATGLTAYLTYLILFTYSASYQAESDSFNSLYLVGPCLAIALFLHPNVTSSWVINVLWAFSTYLEAVALIPQLFVFHSASRTVDNMTSLWIVSLFISRVLECSFWFVALFFRGYMKIWSSIVWYVVVTEAIHTLLLFDFVRNFYKCYQHSMSQLLPSGWGIAGKDDAYFGSPHPARHD
mmetsp:Transcript_20188/g.46839  ORF Transcript_20188/g.46839 Transcript_20188/m.46839 type:complete len:308 (-) Transcript_20188:135-1058(-)